MRQFLRQCQKRNRLWHRFDRPFRTAIEHFQPELYLLCLGTGALSLFANNLPYQFTGLGVISTIFFFIDLVLFILISIAFLSRLALFTKQTLALFDEKVEQTTYLSTLSIALNTLLEIVIVKTSTWRNWQYAVFAFWWFALLYSLTSTMLVYWILVRHESVEVENFKPTLIYPSIGIASCASAGAVLVSCSTLDTTLTQPVLVLSFIIAGFGSFLGLMITTAYMIRLLTAQTPEPKKIAANFLPVGLIANSGYAFDVLGRVAMQQLPAYGRGTVSNLAVAQGMHAVGVMSNLALSGFATFWLIFAIINLMRDVRRTRFNINFWSALYPLILYGIAISQLSSDFDSKAFAVLAAILCILAVIYWLFLVVATIPLIVSGNLFLQEAVEHEDQGQTKGKSQVDSQKVSTGNTV